MITLYHKDFYSIEDFEGEVWKDIQRFDGIYLASNYGRIKRKARTWGSGRKLTTIKTIEESVVRQREIKSGYLKITLCVGSIKKSYAPHILIAETFIPNPKNKIQVNHKDRNKLNNNIDNLEWVTPSENAIHMFLTGHSLKLLTNEDVINIRSIKELNPNITSKAISEILNLPYNSVRRVVNGVGYWYV